MTDLRDQLATCIRCGARLKLEVCGCWTDNRGTRWCSGMNPKAQTRHDPDSGTQPETCEATL